MGHQRVGLQTLTSLADELAEAVAMDAHADDIGRRARESLRAIREGRSAHYSLVLTFCFLGSLYRQSRSSMTIRLADELYAEFMPERTTSNITFHRWLWNWRRQAMDGIGEMPLS